MVKRTGLVIFLFYFFLSVHAAENTSGTEPVSKEQSIEIIQKLTEKYSKMYQKYAGCQSTRHLEVKWYKPGTNELVKTEKVEYTRWDDFYKDLVYKTHSYVVDGEQDDPEDYNPHEAAPGIPVFDQNGVKQYERTVVGIETIKGGIKAYKIKVEPRKPNTRHFKGYIWATVDGLNLTQFEGTAGENRIGLKELHTYFDAKDFGDYYCFTAGEITARIAFFIFQPERVLKFKWHATDFKPMPK